MVKLLLKKKCVLKNVKTIQIVNLPRCYKGCPPGSHSTYIDESVCEDIEKFTETDISKCNNDLYEGHYFDINDRYYK